MKAYLSRLVVGSCACLVPLGLQMGKGQYQLDCPQWDNHPHHPQPKKAAFNSLITLFTMLALVQFVLVGLDVGVNAVLPYLEKYMDKYDVTVSMSGITVKCFGQTAPSNLPSGVADGGRTPGASMSGITVKCLGQTTPSDFPFPSDFPSGVADGGRTPGAGDEHYKPERYEPTCMDMASEVDGMSIEGTQSVSGDELVGDQLVVGTADEDLGGGWAEDG